ncbi:MAG: hypothetical protein JW850_18820 [Thermoflexales bacterium]|nr:hypothetical protein [Thermoflexales bacterium]
MLKDHWNRFLVVALVSISLLTLAPEPAQTAPTAYDPNVLSYGLYWFGTNDANQKFVPGEANLYFDSAKPTLIFVHGWQPGISKSSPPNFTYTYIELVAKNVDTANAWISGGWNVGIFYWNQFADETVVTDAEAKIWVNDGPQRMRWKKDGSSYEEAPAGTPSAAELFYETYLAAMTEQDYTGGNIRIAGHSLGNQMATRLAKLVDDGIEAGLVPEELRPTRVALLDPYWSIGAKTYLNDKTTGETIRQYVAELLPTGTLFEWYRSSVLTVEPEGDSNAALEPMMLYADMAPTFESYDTTHMREHCAAYHLYFWSYAFAGPPPCSGNGCLAMNKLLAKLSDAQLAAASRSDYTWAQSGGQSTPTADDDTYASSPRVNVPYTITQLQAGSAARSVGGVVTLRATVDDSLGDPAPDGSLVTFSTDLGAISARSAVSSGVAIAYLSSALTGTAHISATTQGAGNTPQATASVELPASVSLVAFRTEPGMGSGVVMALLLGCLLLGALGLRNR